MRRKVVITGFGAVSALGLGSKPLWEALLAARSGIAPATLLDASGFACPLVGEVRDASGSASGFSAKDYVPKGYRKAVKVMARDIELAVAAAKFAVEDARLQTRGTLPEGADPASMTYPGERMGCHIGAGLIAAETDELSMALATAVAPDASPESRQARQGFELRLWGTAPAPDGTPGGQGMDNLQPLWMLKYLPNMVACHVTIIHGAEGPSNTLTTGEASGLLSIGESTRVIGRHAADLCFSGGAESKVNHMGLLRLQLAGKVASAKGAADVANVCKPFDPTSQGGVVGEGAGIIVLEAQETATKRGATILAEVLGFGAAQSPLPRQSPVGLTPNPKGLELAIRAALRDANASLDSIDAIVPQGSGVPHADDVEAAALAAVFGPRLRQIPIVTLAPALGECMAGSGGLHAGVAALCLHHQRLPANVGNAKAATLNASARPAGDAKLSRVLVCTSGLGGQNAALVLGKA